MKWQRAEVRCEGDYRIRPGMRVTLKYLRERFSGEYIVERVNHELGIDGFITEVFLRRNMLPREPKRTSAIDEEREQQHNGGGEREDTSQETAEEQEKKNPTISNPHWENSNGEPITKALVGDEVYLCADVTDIPEGATAKIKIVEKDADGNDDDVATLTATVSGGKIECAWKVVYTEDDDDVDSEQEKAEKGYTLPEYAFTVECGGMTSEESGQLDVKSGIKFILQNEENKEPLVNEQFLVLQNGQIIYKGETDSNGYAEFLDLKIGSYTIAIRKDMKKWVNKK